MSSKQSYGKTKLSEEHKMQLATIGASIITVAVGAAALAAGTVNPIAIAGIAGSTTKTAGDVYKFWKTKPDNDLCKRLATQIEEIKNPDPEIIDHDMIKSILNAAARKIQEKADQNNLIPYRDEPDKLFRDIWQEMVHKNPNTLKAEGYYRDVLRVISSNIQIRDIEMQSYLLAMPTEILEGVKSLFEEANREQTEVIKQAQEEANQKQIADLKQYIISVLDQREPPSDLIRLTKHLADKFNSEKEFSPSMRFVCAEQAAPDLFPKAQFKRLDAFVSIDSQEYTENPEIISLKNALLRSWSNKIHHISLFGIGGLGKTTSLLSMEWEAPVVYIPLRNLTERVNNITEYIKENTFDSNSQLYQKFNSLLCNNEWRDKPNVILILDGMNELDISNKGEIIKDIESYWLKRKGLQLIIVSRYDVSEDVTSVDMFRIRLELLDEQQITNYLKNNGVPVPENSSHLWHIINTPLMLFLYAHNRLMKPDRNEDLEYIEDRNAGAIIWNYLQSQILHYIRVISEYKFRERDKVNIRIAVELIAPNIAYRMQQEKVFFITKSKLKKLIREACEALPKCYKELLENESVELFQPSDFYEILTKDICLFVTIDEKIQLMHQHFRDAMAAIYLYQVAKTKENNQIPVEWKCQLDQYVGEFLADLLSARGENGKKLWHDIWDIFKQKPFGSSNDYTDFIKRMLGLFKSAWGNDISEIDFSALDLSKISLCNFRLTSNSKEHFKNTIIDDETFGKNNGHRMMICSISMNPSGTHFLSASHDCEIYLWNFGSDNSENDNCVKINSGIIHSRYIRTSQWCPTDEKKIASAGDNNQLIVWTFNGDEWKPEIKAEGSKNAWIYSLSWTPNGDSIIYGDSEGHINLVSDSGENRNFQSIHSKAIRCIACSNSHLFATCSNEGSDESLVCIWEYHTPTPLMRLQFAAPIKSVQWAWNDKLVAVFTATGFFFY